MQLWQKIIDTPIGPLQALASINGVCWLAFQHENEPVEAPPPKIAPYFPSFQLSNQPNPLLNAAEAWVQHYFLGNSPLPLLPTLDLQGTGFAKRLWATLMSVSLGETQSYAWLANRLSNPKAVRAVGRALRDNPVALMVPCHRIIGANGSLTGYRGGLWRKKWLLDHEQQILRQSQDNHLDKQAQATPPLY